MKKLHKLIYITAAALSLSAMMQANAQIITQWSFSSTVAAPDNTPSPSTGSGTAESLGMTNTYTYAGTTATNSVTSDDITSVTGTTTGTMTMTEDTWRVRGAYVATGTPPNSGSPSGHGNVNGWNLSAPQYSQGVEFDVSTVGYSNISVSFDWFCTTQGIRDLQEQYTIDGTDWININSLQVAVPNDFDGTSTPTNTINLSSIAGASNDPTFGIRLVSAYDPTYTGTGSPTYTSATLVSGSPVQYNNSSGNWSFDNITFSGTALAAPEPNSYALMLGGLVMLIAIHRLRRNRS